MKTLTVLAFAIAFSGQVFASNAQSLSCFGTEPFWKIVVSEKDVIFNDLSSDQVKTYDSVTFKSASGTSADYAFQVEAKNTTNDVLRLNVVKTTCNDGMSDNVYDYTVMVDSNDGILIGCCN